MAPLTYAVVLVMLFVAGAFIFGYFETSRETLKKGLTTLDKRVKQWSSIKVFTLNKKEDRSLTVGLNDTGSPRKTNNPDDLRIYVHEY